MPYDFFFLHQNIGDEREEHRAWPRLFNINNLYIEMEKKKN